MAMNIIEFFGTQIVILALFAIVLILIVIILVIINKKLKREAIKKEEFIEKEEDLRSKIENLKSKADSPEDTLKELDFLAREFFKSTFGISRNMDYSEMIVFFKEKNRGEIAVLCEDISEALYSGDRTDRKKIISLIAELEFIYLEEYPKIIGLPEKQNKKEIEKDKEKESDEMAKKLASINENLIFEAYEKFQKRFQSIYYDIQKQNNEELKKRLEKVRKAIKKRVEEYSHDRFKILELSEEVSRGEKILDLVENSKKG